MLEGGARTRDVDHGSRSCRTARDEGNGRGAAHRVRRGHGLASPPWPTWPTGPGSVRATTSRRTQTLPTPRDPSRLGVVRFHGSGSPYGIWLLRQVQNPRTVRSLRVFGDSFGRLGFGSAAIAAKSGA